LYNISMDIQKARELGFCFGVRRAIRIIEAEAGKGQRIVTLGPIVHNKTVVSRLKGLGVDVVDGVDELNRGITAISSHGVSPAVMEKIYAAGNTMIDTTCPTVRRAQKTAQRLAKAGFGVIIFGEERHPEVRGLLGWAGEHALASQDADSIALEDLPKRVGIMAQTTQTHDDFIRFSNRLRERLLPRSREIRVVNTLCQETQKRQSAAQELAGQSDLMIVVGGHNSANTRRLAEVCSTVVETHHIENAGEIDTVWLKDKKAVGITAGASTPDEAIEQVIERIRSIAAG